MHAEITGDFEIHLTVSAGDLQRLAAFAEENGLKLTHILLDRGVSPSQPMLTLGGSGTLERQCGKAERWVERLKELGIRVVRVKIEAAPWNEGVPATDDEAKVQPAPRYFEHHVKILLPEGDLARLRELTELAEAHRARPSRSVRRKRADGWEERSPSASGWRGGRPPASFSTSWSKPCVGQATRSSPSSRSMSWWTTTSASTTASSTPDRWSART
ncbi:hypothetical protein [Actinokineospora xionganensis]|uniref:hypothetical protein n=1 Tax=Actinokineospora xionganensis TaxID=2684470 RepID=UPI001C9D59A5|nr:hypothetical protein [Actinokineospora xionganensis]